MTSVNETLYKRILLFVRDFLCSFFTSVFPLFGFLKTYVFRLKRDDCNFSEDYHHPRVVCGEENLEFIECKAGDDEEDEENEEFVISEGLKNDKIVENEPEFCFKFKFPTYEELSKSRGESGNIVGIEAVTSESTNRYELNSAKSLNCIINETEVLKCEVKEGDIDSSGGYIGDKKNDFVHDDGFSLNHEFCKFMIDDVHEEIENSIALLEEEEHNLLKDDLFSKESNGLEWNLESDSDSNSDSDSDSSSSNHLHSVMSNFLDSYGDGFLSDGGGFLSDGDFGGEFDQEHSLVIDGEKIQSSEENLNEEEEYEREVVMEENKVLEEGNLFQEQREKTGDFDEKHNPDKEKISVQDSEETNNLESLWEHQELIEQLKMELKKVRATGLPTILEESESPKVMEDLKPWKIDAKFHHENPMGELQIFYKSYRERMRKLDILNYQKMYAIGFLQLKDPLQPVPTNKSSIPEIATFLSQYLDQSKHKKKQSEPTMKIIKELRSDMELVYVGHMCLSWEILHWQYGKALDLWESDPRGIRLFNEVAGEFQQFNIFMQRFIEDECFQGPRVQNYIKNRCVLRHLLQVPVIREDNSKDKRKSRLREKGEYVITSEVLVEIIEESIRIFWRFVKGDKDCANSTGKGKIGRAQELQDPNDFALLMEVQKNLLKKDRKLKDILRSGNCILRKIKKCREDSSDSDNQVLYFFSQVDMKLVSRVLNMSRLTTDQLIWCRNKLSKISLVGRKIQVEPAFLLFPC